jgi:UDP-2-acetamido-2-deoxy-ribo-hexuluronate aminotransferase
MIPFIDLKSQYKLIQDKVNQSIQKVLEHGMYINGPEIAEFETALAKYTGTKYAVACSSGTDALLMALMALDVKPGDEIITTPFTFIATAEVIALLQAVPVFVDIDEKTYNIDPAKIESKITSKTRAIMPVSLYGQCADFDEINEIAKKHNLPVIEDGAQSFGASYKGRKSCGLSTIGCTSFFPSKPLGAYGDAGAILTDDENIATVLKHIREHGQDRRYNHPRLGINGRMDSIQAAVLLAKLSVFNDEVKSRAVTGKKYSDALKDVATVPYVKPDNVSVYAQYTIQVDNREKVMEKLKEQGVPTAVHYPIPLHLQPVFSYMGQGAGSFPIAERIAQRVISLPMHPYLKSEDQQKVIEAVKNSVV